MPRLGRTSDTYRRFLDQAIAALALEQHGVFALHQLLGLGLTARAIQHREATGRLHRIHRGVYSLVPKQLLKREGLYMAAVLACGPGAVLSHRSAAVLHGLRDWGTSKIEVTVPTRSARAHPGVAVHRSTTLTEADVTVVNNIPVTTVARTHLDLADVVTPRQLERSFDQAEIAETLDLKAIQDQLARNPTRPGAKKIRKILAEHYIVPCVLRPSVSTTTRWSGQAKSARRDQRLIAAGWIVIRTTWRQIKHRPDELRETLLKLLGRASPNGHARPDAAGAPTSSRPRTRRAGGST